MTNLTHTTALLYVLTISDRELMLFSSPSKYLGSIVTGDIVTYTGLKHPAIENGLVRAALQCHVYEYHDTIDSVNECLAEMSFQTSDNLPDNYREKLQVLCLSIELQQQLQE